MPKYIFITGGVVSRIIKECPDEEAQLSEISLAQII